MSKQDMVEWLNEAGYEISINAKRDAQDIEDMLKAIDKAIRIINK